MNLKDQFTTFNRTSLAKNPWLQIRKNGFAYFAKHGIPSKKNEDWKYTSLQFLNSELAKPATASPKLIASLEAIKENIKSFLSPQFLNLVFVDGEFLAEISDLKPVQKEIGVEHLASAIVSTKTNEVLASIQNMRRQIPLLKQDSLEALNSSFSNHGVMLSVKANVSCSKPVQILHFSTSSGGHYPKILVSLEAKSKLTLLQTFIGGSASSYTNAVTEIAVQDSAKIEFACLQDQEMDSSIIHRTRVLLASNSTCESVVHSTGSKLSRHNLDVYCLGAGASAQVNGFTLTGGRQHTDNHTNIEHVVGGCTTTQLYKSLLDDSSRVVFNGRVHIHTGAAKATSSQLNNNLLLNSNAEADSKPELAIYNDDVTATHGSTMGQLNEDELFYFQSRAISKEKATELLSLGFVKEIMGSVAHPALRDFLNRHLQAAYSRLKEKS